MQYSLEQQLLHSALLCGLEPGTPIYRNQLFVVANKELASRSHYNDFQRELETCVDRKGYFNNFEEKWGGEYTFTSLGIRCAKIIFPGITPKYRPMRRKEYNCKIMGVVAGETVIVETYGNRSYVSISGDQCRSAVQAYNILAGRLGIPGMTVGESAVRLLYNLAVDNGFYMELPHAAVITCSPTTG